MSQEDSQVTRCSCKKPTENHKARRLFTDVLKDFVWYTTSEPISVVDRRSYNETERLASRTR